jgi:nucleoid DNA-binding protein
MRSSSLAMSVSRAFAKEVNKDIEDLGLKVGVVETVCSAFLNRIINEVKAGRNVTFKNTLTFKRVLRRDRTHQNPKTHEEIFKAAHYVIVLDMKKQLKEDFCKIEVGSVEPVEEETKSE